MYALDNEYWENDFMLGFLLSPPPASLHTKLQRKFVQLLWLGWLFKSSLFMCYLFMWMNYLKFGALYKGSSLQIMTPLHSLPMGRVCNFLEYKSCIIHAYRRATSINYVSLLGACVFTTSTFFLWFLIPSFSRSLLCSITTVWRGKKKRRNPWLGIFPPLLCLIAQFMRVKWTVSNFQLVERWKRATQKRKKVLRRCCDVNALI